MPASRYLEENGPAAMLAAKMSVTPEENLSGSTFMPHLLFECLSGNIALHQKSLSDLA